MLPQREKPLVLQLYQKRCPIFVTSWLLARLNSKSATTDPWPFSCNHAIVQLCNSAIVLIEHFLGDSRETIYHRIFCLCHFSDD